MGLMAEARLLLKPYRPIPSVLRDEGSTSIATVLLATVVKPKGIPCTVLTTANSTSVPAATYPTKKSVNTAKLSSSTVFLGKLSTI